MATDVARALGVPKKDASFFESDRYVVGFAVGHLVEQVDPDAYDAALQDVALRGSSDPAGRVPLRGARRQVARSSSASSTRRSRRKDVTEVVNACDAGREGELIFKLILQTAGVAKPVRRALVLVDDAARDPRRLRAAARTTPSCGRSRTPPALALRGRLARRHEREPRRDDAPRRAPQPALARSRADADARARRQPRPRDRPLRAGGLLAGARRASRPPAAPPTRARGSRARATA